MGLCFSRRRRRIVPKRKLKPPKEKQDRLIDDVNTLHRNIIGKIQPSNDVIREVTESVPNGETHDSREATDVYPEKEGGAGVSEGYLGFPS